MRRALLTLILLSACTTQTEIVDPRNSCEVCHSPRPAPGESPVGIDNAHPFGTVELSCVDCHGGDDTAYKRTEAHVDHGEGPKALRNLSSGQLDRVDQKYLRFVNPGDLRVAYQSCGSDSPAGPGCHQNVVDSVGRSIMAHTAGEVSVARYRAGVQTTSTALRRGATAIFDPDFDPDRFGTVEAMLRFDPAVPDLTNLDALSDPAAATSTEGVALFAQVQDDYIAKSCFRCHLWDFGENRFAGDFRSSGCSACHMLYNNEGTSASLDPTIAYRLGPFPVRHEITSAIPTDQCTRCHYRGGRIGPSFQGYRESGGPGRNPQNPEALGEALHGHDFAFYITDEDTTNTVDETPPDIHFERGMHCIDCHFGTEVHGDGHIYETTEPAVAIECESCHGTISTEADPATSRAKLERDEAGDIWLIGRVDGARHPVKQVARSVDPESPEYNALADVSMGRDQAGFSHSDRIECYTCHASWYPSCYGCHITMDYSRPSRLLTTGEARVGKPAGARAWVATDDLVLMWNTKGMIAPSMPAERFTMTVKDAQGETRFERRPRRKAGMTTPTFGQRTFQPHTIRKGSPFSSCDRCHIRDDGSNEALVRVTLGLGSDRYIMVDETGTEYRLDAIVDPEGKPLVDVGHQGAEASRPLEAQLRRRLLQTPVR